MWAHYAKNNTGFVIGYDEFLINPKRGAFMPVNYINSPTKITIGLTENQKITNKYIDARFRDAIISKHISWAYEHEVRAIIFAEEPANNTSNKYKFHTNQNAIKEIIFGCKISHKTKCEIKNALSEKGGDDIKYYNAKLNPFEFRINIIEEK